MLFLVTGATGRTGAGVVRHLQAAGEEVRVLVRDADKAKAASSDARQALAKDPGRLQQLNDGLKNLGLDG